MRKYEKFNLICENREPQRAYYIPKSGYTLLNGEWDFKFYDADYEENYIEKPWEKIDVPSCWQSRGYEHPNYTNGAYPYPYEPPYVPDDNPMGVYRREFEIKDTNREAYIVFEGVSSCLELFINDEYVGYSQGSRHQAEFKITDFVACGTNTITVKVRKWCLGSYLEDQDAFRYNGIFRDVYLLSRPKGHIKDIDIKTCENVINIDFEGSAKISLFDKEGTLLDTVFAENKASFCVDNPVKWNAEKPYLYELEFCYEDEVITQKIGFVTYSIGKDYEFLVNGIEVKLKGVNRHDTHPYNGWTMTDEELYDELLLMKKYNINTVRTAHYPPTAKYLDMCDELGFYVMLETDLETHGALNREAGGCGYDCVDNPMWPCSNPDFKPAFLDRMIRAYERDKNHTSIFSWSTGNESGHGDNHVAMIDYIRERDKSRLVHVQNASLMSEMSEHYGKDLRDVAYRADVFSTMYEPIEKAKGHAEDENFIQPYFFCEYCHSMGNGPGDVCDYWETIYKYKKLIGGCLWEWADHTVVENGVAKYGGDFPDELTHDANFCADGMLFYDRTPKAGSYEVKAAYQYMDCELSGDEITVLNRYDFTNLSEYEFKYQVKADGELKEEKTFVLDIAPKETKCVKITLPKECELGAFVHCYLYDKTGYCVAQKQLEIPVLIKEKVYDAEECDVIDDENFIKFFGHDFSYTFSKKKGTFISLVKNGEEQILSPIRITSARAPIDNERNIKQNWYWYNIWESENLDRQIEKVYACTLSGAEVTVEGSLSGVARTPYLRYTLKYKVSKDGTIKVTLDGNIKEKAMWLPRLGFEIKTSYEKSEFSYFGMGPHESYCDMHRASMIDWYESDADSEYVNYIMPQEHGNHIKTKVLNIKNGLTFESLTGLEFNVSHYTTEMLAKATHQDELEKSEFTNIRIDYKNSGVGSASCGPRLLDKYKLAEKEVHFEFFIK